MKKNCLVLFFLCFLKSRTRVCTIFETGNRANSGAVEWVRRTVGSDGFLVIWLFVEQEKCIL